MKYPLGHEMIWELTPTQDCFRAVRVPERTLDWETAADLVDQLQELLPLWRVSAPLDLVSGQCGAIRIESPQGFSDCGGQAHPGDWIILKKDGAFAVVQPLDAAVLFDWEEFE